MFLNFFNNENFSTLKILILLEEIKFDSFYIYKNMSYQESLSYNITAVKYILLEKTFVKR